MKARIEPIVRDWLGDSARLLDCRPLEGGWINEVLEIEVDREPFKAVLKLPKPPSGPKDDGTEFVPPECSFAAEANALRHLRSQSKLNVPEVYHVFEEDRDGSHLILERLPGQNLESVELTDAERAAVDRQMADDLLELHSHAGPAFGVVGGEPRESWLDVFGPMIRDNFRQATPKLDTDTRDRIAKLLEALPEVFADSKEPRLIHGDAWAGNILVDRGPDGPRLSGWVDPGPAYADVELELAYLAVFGTAGDAFFERYRAASPRRPGYEVRKLFYWLNTMLIHAWVFGYPRYMERATEMSRELAKALG